MDRYSHIRMAIILWLAAVLIALTFALATAADCTLTWNHDGAEGYRLYMAEMGQPLVKTWQGPEKSVPVVLQDGKTYQFAVTAYQGTVESAQSDILQYTVPTPQQIIVVPGKPAELVIKFE